MLQTTFLADVERIAYEKLAAFGDANNKAALEAMRQRVNAGGGRPIWDAAGRQADLSAMRQRVTAGGGRPLRDAAGHQADLSAMRQRVNAPSAPAAQPRPTPTPTAPRQNSGGGYPGVPAADRPTPQPRSQAQAPAAQPRPQQQTPAAKPRPQAQAPAPKASPQVKQNPASAAQMPPMRAQAPAPQPRPPSVAAGFENKPSQADADFRRQLLEQERAQAPAPQPRPQAQAPAPQPRPQAQAPAPQQGPVSAPLNGKPFASLGTGGAQQVQTRLNQLMGPGGAQRAEPQASPGQPAGQTSVRPINLTAASRRPVPTESMPVNTGSMLPSLSNVQMPYLVNNQVANEAPQPFSPGDPRLVPFEYNGPASGGGR